MSQHEQIRKTAFELRREFDAQFARTPESRPDGLEDFLTIRLAGFAYAVRLADTSGLFQNKNITPLPSRMSSLLGIAGFRGTIVPVYSLRVWMAHPANATSTWMFLTRSNVAFAFDELDSYTRISHNDILPATPGEAAREHVREVARVGAIVLPIVNLASILDSIRAPLRPAVSKEE